MDLHVDLNEVITEELRNFCYIFDNVHSYIQERLNVQVIELETGSSAEGCVPYSDVDRMIYQNDVIAVKDVHSLSKENSGKLVLLLDTQECYPGYARLKVHQNPPDGSFSHLHCEIDGEYFFVGSRYKSSFVTKFEEPLEEVDNDHGPAVLKKGDNLRKDRDLVACVKCNFLPPRVAQITQHSSNAFFDAMAPLTCHAVPVAHATSQKPEIEFRLSFSVAEKRLIQKWTIKQMRCYFWGKFLKNIANALRSGNQGQTISSYLIKTTMFWLIEDKSVDYWVDSPISDCVREMWNKLCDFLRKRNLPSYFIPESNLICSMSEEDIEYCLSVDIISIFLKIYPGNEENEDDALLLTKKSIHERISTTEQCKGYIFDLQRFILNLYSRNDGEIVNSIVLEDIIKEIHQLLPESLIKVTLFIVLYRCLALYKMSEAWETDDLKKSSELLTDAYSLFNQSLQIPCELITDHGLTGFVYISFLLAQASKREEALHFLQKVFSVREQLNTLWKICCIPVILPAGRNDAVAKYIGNDPIGNLMHKKNATYYDPMVFAVYLLNQYVGEGAFSLFPTEVNDQSKKSSYDVLKLLTIEKGHIVDYLRVLFLIKENTYELPSWIDSMIENLQLETKPADRSRVDTICRIFPGQLIKDCKGDLLKNYPAWNYVLEDQNYRQRQKDMQALYDMFDSHSDEEEGWIARLCCCFR